MCVNVFHGSLTTLFVFSITKYAGTWPFLLWWGLKPPKPRDPDAEGVEVTPKAWSRRGVELEAL